MAPLHGLLLKEPRALEKKGFSFILWAWASPGKPGKAKETISLAFLSCRSFLFSFCGPDHIVLFSAWSLVTRPRNNMA